MAPRAGIFVEGAKPKRRCTGRTASFGDNALGGKTKRGGARDCTTGCYVERCDAYSPTATSMSDEQLEDEIEDELFWSPFVDADQIRVRVSDGVATLTGTVDTWREREAASENAYEGGAVYVNNLLHVEL